MSRENKLTTRIFAVAIMVLGIVFGCTWNSTGFCIGDNIFSAVGFPLWSGGTNGVHYPGMLGLFFVFVGAGILNTTLSLKIRKWVWKIVIALFVVINVLHVYLK